MPFARIRATHQSAVAGTEDELVACVFAATLKHSPLHRGEDITLERTFAGRFKCCIQGII